MRYETQKTGRPGQVDSTGNALAKGLGIFSIAPGIYELLAPCKLGKALGLSRHEKLIQSYGVREILSGVAILSAKDPTPWVSGRVAGDVVDIGTLLWAMETPKLRKQNVWIALANVLGVTALDVYTGMRLSSDTKKPEPPMHDYSDRIGMPFSPGEMHGIASDFEVPRDVRTPEAMRPFTSPSNG